MKKQGSNWRTLLNRWISGQITAREEQELDRSAQKDPFLSDALEGYRQQPESDHAGQVAKLKAKFQKEKKRRGIPLWRIAAAVAILIVAGISMWQINTNKGQDLAQMETAVEESTPAPSTFDTNPPPVSYDDVASKESSIDETVPNQNQLAHTTAPSPTPKTNTEKQVNKISADPVPRRISPALQPAAKEPSAVNRPEITLAEQAKEGSVLTEAEDILIKRKGAAEGENIAVVPSDYQALKPEAVPTVESNQNIYFVQTQVQSKRKRNQQVNGAVLSENGTPLPGVKVSLPGTSKSITTDGNGQFNLSVPSSTQQLQLTYFNQNKVFQIGGRDSFTLDLNAPGFTTPIIAMQKRNRNSRKKVQDANTYTIPATPDVTPVAPRPSIDSTAYRQYIKDNLRYPATAKAAGATGAVTLRFSFDENGKPFNFLLLKSMGYGCDEEAIRLIREGPAWIAPDYSITTYTIHFDL